MTNNNCHDCSFVRGTLVAASCPQSLTLGCSENTRIRHDRPIDPHIIIACMRYIPVSPSHSEWTQVLCNDLSGCPFGRQAAFGTTSVPDGPARSSEGGGSATESYGRPPPAPSSSPSALTSGRTAPEKSSPWRELPPRPLAPASFEAIDSPWSSARCDVFNRFGCFPDRGPPTTPNGRASRTAPCPCRFPPRSPRPISG